MLYVDLSEIEQLLSKSLLWGYRWYHLARFKRSDYFSIDGNFSQSIDAAVRKKVGVALDFKLDGPIRLLTNLRYFGYTTNPISCYYCFDSQGEHLTALMLEVTNTPWGERYQYVLDMRQWTENDLITFEKQMHVSPFMPMNRSYQWKGMLPSEVLRYSLTSIEYPASVSAEASTPEAQEALRHFDSGVVFKRLPVSASSLNQTLLAQPLMTFKVIAAIYWQAFRLWIKKIRFLPHPKKAKQNLDDALTDN